MLGEGLSITVLSYYHSHSLLKNILCVYNIMAPKPSLHLLEFVPSHYKVSFCCWTTSPWQRKIPPPWLMACDVVMNHATWKRWRSKYLRVHGHCCQFNKDIFTGCVSSIASEGLWWRHFVFPAEISRWNTIFLFNFMQVWLCSYD